MPQRYQSDERLARLLSMHVVFGNLETIYMCCTSYTCYCVVNKEESIAAIRHMAARDGTCTDGHGALSEPTYCDDKTAPTVYSLLDAHNESNPPHDVTLCVLKETFLAHCY